MTLYRLFERVATRAPDRVAIVSDEGGLTYQELRARAADVAAALLEAKVEPGDLVGVELPHGLDAIVTILAILRLGCAYVPIDPAYPESRRDYIRSHSGISHTVREWETQTPVLASQECRRKVPGAAYVMYTSGSTGEPKGVVVTEGNVLSLLRYGLVPYDLSSVDSWCAFHSHSFDFSVWELWGALSTGASIFIPSAHQRTNMRSFADALAGNAVSVLNVVPTTFKYLIRMLQRQPQTSLTFRYVIFGGEKLDPDIIRLAAGLPNLGVGQYVNMYGITEATVHSTAFPFGSADELMSAAGATRIGRSLPHVELRVDDGVALRDAGTEMPVTGELIIGGPSVAAGYLGDPPQYASRFWTDELGERWLRTGDRVTLGTDGQLSYIGRMDRQVKVRGFRVELDEVEVQLRTIDEVDEAIAFVSGEVLVAGVVLHALGGEAVLSGVIRRVRLLLPAHLCPSRLYLLETLIFTASGKLDRAASIHRLQDRLSRGDRG